MQRRFRLLAALLVIAVMHNGVSAAPLMADGMQGMAGHVHHGHDMPGTPGKSDCCDAGACKCGCTSTSPVPADRPAPVMRDWGRIADLRTNDAREVPTGTTGAPYRPPA